MRGKQMMYLDENGNERITPAGAGKTRDNQHPPPARQDHPRRCGENSEPYTVILSPLRITPAGAGKTVQTSLFRPARRGSPPQVRGKPVCNSERNVNAGITPAGAGKTLHGGASSMRTRDHPRRCGENFRPPLQAPSCIGSPPQVRGKLFLSKIHCKN